MNNLITVNLHKVIDQFKDKKILVVGDLILDKYIWGEVDRISPEAPIPVIDVTHENDVAGGAANTAHNIAALGGKAVLIGVVGNDHNKEVLFNELKKQRVEIAYIVTDKKRPTTHKTRVIAQSQHLVRIDDENKQPVDGELTRTLVKNIKKIIEKVEIVVVSDYAKGVVTQQLMHELAALCQHDNKKLIVDPKPQHSTFYKNVFLITPNYREAREMVHPPAVESSQQSVDFLGNALVRQLNTKVLITQGKEGMTLFEQNAQPLHIPTIAQEVYDVSGAGDTVVATLALALCCGCTVKDAAVLANYAAGIVVGKIGTAVVSPDELRKSLGG